MRKRGDTRKYKIVEPNDDLIPHKVSIEPIQLFGKDEANDDLAEAPKFEDEEAEKQFYRDALDEAGVDYHHATGLEKLKIKYEAI